MTRCWGLLLTVVAVLFWSVQLVGCREAAGASETEDLIGVQSLFRPARRPCRWAPARLAPRLAPPTLARCMLSLRRLQMAWHSRSSTLHARSCRGHLSSSTRVSCMGMGRLALHFARHLSANRLATTRLRFTAARRWGDGGNGSGLGSTLESTVGTRALLVKAIQVRHSLWSLWFCFLVASPQLRPPGSCLRSST